MLARIFLVLLFTAPALAQMPVEEPDLAGYVTAVSATGAFSLEAVSIQLSPKVEFYRKEGKSTRRVDHLDAPYLGQSMAVYGKFDRKAHTLTAKYILQYPPSLAEVRGGAMIDLAPASAGPDHVFRADGYLLHLTTETTLHFNPPLTTLADLGTNVWIEYRGVQQLDGSVIVNAAEVWPNTIPKAEENLKTKREFDPSAVKDEDKQSGVSKAFLGYDARKLPAHHDEELQAHIQRIGESLIPAYQKALPESDPTRIHFRFQLVETDHYRDAITFANGIILVPWPAIGRLQNDSQIATVLADNIACAIEKQEILHQPTATALKAASWAGLAGGLFVPGLGIATGLAAGSAEHHAMTMHERQSGRVSLALMHDAGYDLHEAPIAWRLLAPKKPEPLEKGDIGDRANYIYATLGDTWR